MLTKENPDLSLSVKTDQDPSEKLYYISNCTMNCIQMEAQFYCTKI